MTKYAQREAALNAMRAFMDKHPEMNDEQLEEYNSLEAKFDTLDASIKREEKISAAQAEMNKDTSNPLIDEAMVAATATKDYMSGFNSYMRGGELGDLKAAMTVGTDADGGFIVPQTYQSAVFEKLHTLSETRQISTVIGTQSTKNIPIEGDAPTFAWIDEGAAYGETKSTFGNKQIGAFKLGGIIKVSEELINDEMVGFEDYMANQIAVGIDKAEAPAFCTGDGVGKPTGYTTGLAAGVTLSTTTGITENEIVEIYYALPEAYRKRATWRLNTNTLKKIRGIKDSNGVSIYKEEIKNGTIEGRPFKIDDNMPDMAANAKAIIFGDFKFYQIGDRGDMSVQRLNERYADVGLIGFKVRVRVDAKRMLDEPFVIAANAAV